MAVSTGVFVYACRACGVTGSTAVWPPGAVCWCCGGGNAIVPASFEGNDRDGAGSDPRS